MMSPAPSGLPGIAAVAIVFGLFGALLLWARWRSVADDGPQQRAKGWWVGLAGQALGFAVTGWGSFDVSLDPLSASAWLAATCVVILGGFALALFAASVRTMGRNWDISARTRSDHQLVQAGPFAHMRHPIYVALFALLIALALGWGHWLHFFAGAAIYIGGTALRVRDEEALLRAKFGPAYDDYAARVKRFGAF